MAYAEGGYFWGGTGYTVPEQAVITVTDAKPLMIPESSSIVAFEAFGTAIAAVGIALGLSKDETKQLGAVAYARVRGKEIEEKYEALITLAYEIKNRGTDG